MTQASCLLSVLSWRSSGQPRHPCQVSIYKDLSPNLLVSKSGLLIKSPLRNKRLAKLFYKDIDIKRQKN